MTTLGWLHAGTVVLYLGAQCRGWQKLLKGIAKRQKQEEVWDNLGRRAVHSTVQNIYFNFHLYTVQCMSSVYHAVKQNCASHHLGRLCLLTLDLHLVSKIMECTVVLYSTTVLQYTTPL